MTNLPSVVSATEAIRAFGKAGFEFDRQRGSHITLVKAGHPNILTVPNVRELAKGTLRALIRDSGLSRDEFIALLKE